MFPAILAFWKIRKFTPFVPIVRASIPWCDRGMNKYKMIKCSNFSKKKQINE